MTVLVTGGTGMIGATVVGLLCGRGERVAIFCRNPPQDAKDGGRVQWIAGDVADRNHVRAAVAQSRADRIVHLAGLLQFACEREPERAVAINVDGTVNVLEAAREASARRVVFGSTISIFGDRTDTLVEDAPPGRSVSFYGQTKRFGEEAGAAYARLYGLEFVALRYCGVFGPGEVKGPGMAMVRQQIVSTAQGRSVVVDGASGEERGQLLYVLDAARATIAALDHPRPRHAVYNLAGPPENYISLRAFHDRVRALVPRAGDVRFTGRARDMGPVDISRIATDLDFRPRYSVDEGLREILTDGASGRERRAPAGSG